MGDAPEEDMPAMKDHHADVDGLQNLRYEQVRHAFKPNDLIVGRHLKVCREFATPCEMK